MKKFIKKIFWRLQFKKVKHEHNTWMKGRCIDCDAGNPEIECSEYGCPCNYNQNLKRVRKFKFLYKTKQ